MGRNSRRGIMISEFKIMDLLARFEQILREQNLVKPGERVFVACSGGPDSVALAYLFHALQEKWYLRLGLLHFNHGIRGREAERDEKFVRRLAARWGWPVYGGRARVKALSYRKDLSLEEAAREARYAYFLRMAKQHRLSLIHI